MTPEGSTHVNTAFTGTTSSFSRTASGKVAVVAVVHQRVFVKDITHHVAGGVQLSRSPSCHWSASTRKAAVTRLRIVEAAAAEIRERGTNAITLDDVCRRSSTGKGQMFHYFPEGREQLLLAVAELEAERVFDDQQPYLGELTSRAAWEAWRDLIVERYRDQGGTARSGC